MLAAEAFLSSHVCFGYRHKVQCAAGASALYQLSVSPNVYESYLHVTYNMVSSFDGQQNALLRM